MIRLLIIKFVSRIFYLFGFFPISLTAQNIFIQDYFHGGVIANGYSQGSSGGLISSDILIPQIPQDATITKAFLLVGRHGLATDLEIEFNGDSYLLNATNQVTTPFLSIYGGYSGLHYINVIESVSTDILSYHLSTQVLQTNQIGSSNKFTEFFLFIFFEHIDSAKICATIVVNYQDFAPEVTYLITGLNPILANEDVGLSIFSGYVCDTITDGEFIIVENENFGLIGGSDVGSENCGGPIGSFHYSNNSLYGLNDDLSNETFSASDALARINSVIEMNVTNLEINFITKTQGNFSNSIWGVNLTYTTPCQPFETSLTEEVAVCRGDSAQLLATGGTSTGSVPGYEWLPQEDLSCYDCPNPVFVGDSTRHYTVRIWNTDSCSKVLPVKVLVYDVPTQANLILNPATCSESNGSLSISNVVGGTPQYVYNIGGNDSTNPNFNNLAPGVYNLQITDANSCTYNQPFTIEEINPVTAAFSANPQQGVAPLNVNFTNQSTGANLYQWLVNTQSFESFNLNYTFDTAGTYPVQLIASYNEPHCADTALKVVVVENDFSVIIPTLFHSSQGTWGITTSNVVQIKAQVYNAIGQLIHQSQQTANNGPNPIWPADENATGYYFYRLQLTDVEGKEHGYEGKVLVVN